MIFTINFPSMLNMRDAILVADLATNGGANQSLIWSAFACRGMGNSASTASHNDQNPVEAFDLPSGEDCRSGASKTYEVWISQSFAAPPYAPFHDCLTLTQNSISLLSCSAGGPAVVEPDVVGSLVGIIPVCGGSPLNLLFLGNALDGTDIGFQADTIGGIIAGIDQLTTFGFEGIRNDGCFLSSGDTDDPLPLSTP
jgi:hypothetical protein